MSKPSVYYRGSTVELEPTFYDTEGTIFTPTETRITVTAPDESTVTVSGVATLIYEPSSEGFYTYAAWGKDSEGREVLGLNGFYVEPSVT